MTSPLIYESMAIVWVSSCRILDFRMMVTIARHLLSRATMAWRLNGCEEPSSEDDETDESSSSSNCSSSPPLSSVDSFDSTLWSLTSSFETSLFSDSFPSLIYNTDLMSFSHHLARYSYISWVNRSSLFLLFASFFGHRHKPLWIVKLRAWAKQCKRTPKNLFRPMAAFTLAPLSVVVATILWTRPYWISTRLMWRRRRLETWRPLNFRKLKTFPWRWKFESNQCTVMHKKWCDLELFQRSRVIDTAGTWANSFLNSRLFSRYIRDNHRRTLLLDGPT